VSDAQQALAQRIRELRRRHFGPRGKQAFAQKLGVRLTEYERYERGTVPPGHVLVRMCELTGEDLQWLLTGVTARGTVVISGARHRHRDLLARIARALDAHPTLATPLEAFLDLLLRSAATRQETAPGLPVPVTGELIPVFDRGHWPERLPVPDAQGGSGPLVPVVPPGSLDAAERTAMTLVEPALDYGAADSRTVTLLTLPDAGGLPRRFVQSRELACCFPLAFGVTMDDDAMAPMFAVGDIVLTTVGAEPQLGRPALCKFADQGHDRCRIWLGQDDRYVHLGRASDGQHEELPRAQFRWALEALYRVARAA